MTDSQTFLADYVRSGSEPAFRELVTRYLGLVYATAIRLAGGDTHLAEDVAQTVFVDLARLAKNLSKDVKLGGWLHRHTCFVAAKMLRGERRRQFRERQAVAMNSLLDSSEAHFAEIAPLLDDAINRLGATDRAAVVLRFYERLDFLAVGHALGTSEAAAQKRVTRALAKLHAFLKHRGVTCSAAALALALAGENLTGAPAGLAASISSTAVASASAGTGSTFTFFKFMAATKVETGIVTAVLIASVMTPLLLQHRAQARLREQDEAARQQSSQLASLGEDNKHLAAQWDQPTASRSAADPQLRELLRLRSEVGRLKQTVQDLTQSRPHPISPEDQLASLTKQYAAQVNRLKQWLLANPSELIPELEHSSNYIWLHAVANLGDTEDDLAAAASTLRDNAQLQVFDVLWGALRQYAKANDGQFPASMSQLTPFLRSPIDDAILQRYEIVPASSLVGELQPGGAWVITQSAAANPALDVRWAYGLTESRMADSRVPNRWTTLH